MLETGGGLGREIITAGQPVGGPLHSLLDPLGGSTVPETRGRATPSIPRAEVKLSKAISDLQQDHRIERRGFVLDNDCDSPTSTVLGARRLPAAGTGGKGEVHFDTNRGIVVVPRGEE